MVGERIIEDIPNNIGLLVEDVRPRSSKSLVKIVIDAEDRFGRANRRVVHKVIGKAQGVKRKW